MALCAHRIRPLGTQVRRHHRIVHRAARHNCLADDVIPFENVRITRTVWTIWSRAAKLPIVVAAMTIRTEDLVPDYPGGLGGAILIQHVGPQARLRQWTIARVRYGVTRSSRRAELRNNIQLISNKDQPRW